MNNGRKICVAVLILIALISIIAANVEYVNVQQQPIKARIYVNFAESFKTEELCEVEVKVEEAETETQTQSQYIDCDMPKEHQDYLKSLCEEYDIAYSLAMALIKKESSFHSDSVSESQDYGYMQINICNHASLKEILGLNDMLDPYQNLKAGMYLLAELFEKYDSPSMVLMAYNLGENAAKKKWNSGIYETEYSRAILEYQAEIEKELKGGE